MITLFNYNITSKESKEDNEADEHMWQHNSSNELLLFAGVSEMWVDGIKCL